MNNLSCKFIFILLAICITATSFQLHAQAPGSGKLTGKIVDAQTNETIPFASAVIMNRQTKVNVATGQTDVNGNLVINGIPNGTFSIKISYVGYQTLVRDSVSVSASKQMLALGTIKMKASKGTVLNEVNVTAKKAPIQLGIDKKVFSVDQSLVSEGGSASDLLTNVPSVQIDVDGNVSLRGSTGVKVLIDGKPSLIAGGDIASILASIPASSIETVEVITNPSSKYDAEGNSGIINIVLKRNSKLGLNGNIALTAGNRDNYNGNASLSFQNNKINLYGNYGYRYGKRIGGGYNNITYLNRADSLGRAEQLTTSNQLEKTHNAKAGIDYYLTKKDILSFGVSYNKRDQDKRDFLNVNTYNNIDGSPILLSDRINTTDGSGDSYDLNLDYSHKWKPNQELTFNFGYSHGTNDNFQQYNTTVLSQNGLPATDPSEILTNDNDGTNKNYNIQADYTMPLGKLGKLETGYRSQIKYSDNNTIARTYNDATGAFDNNYQLSNLFNSKDQVHALYANYSNQIKNFGYQVGLRGEMARLNTNSGGYDLNGTVTNAAGRIAYDRLYPSIFLTQKFKGEQQLQLSYTRRVNRPRPWDTNPFIDYSDPLSWRQGNPNLLPEDVHSYELSYSKFWPKVTLITSLYSRHTNDLIQRVRSAPDSAGVIILTPFNLTQSTNSGLEIIAKVDPVKAWSFTANVNGYHSNIDAVPAYNINSTSGYSWNANLTNNFTLPYNISLQIRGDYNSTELQAQGKRKAMYGVDAGAKYDFPNKKASLSFNMRDIFNTRKFGAIIQDANTITDFQRYQKGQMGNLTFSYRFGKTTFQKKQKKQEQQEQKPDEGTF
ncbi:Outer membrane receptor proteins, mostly Fe transport [Pedobacter westerhofensis]|uniref:Outer membrane receptor proteins, mostly Fe transport n=1 Tax=Pedobacter westerhofensis TaxID=425512 RepID=A0A521EH40_9SPHI|nr:outer membrane beta-barrel family protein [Pedobacter westerhofensis]SMO83225.1 Outer membrane receptor proteins, mostly Fe transport [Pedobacter westerhofensis]